MTAPVIIPLFVVENQQAVRIPLEFSFEADTVQVSRNADGDLVIRPLPVNPQQVMVRALQAYADGKGAEFAKALHEEGVAAVPVVVDTGRS